MKKLYYFLALFIFSDIVYISPINTPKPHAVALLEARHIACYPLGPKGILSAEEQEAFFDIEKSFEYSSVGFQWTLGATNSQYKTSYEIRKTLGLLDWAKTLIHSDAAKKVFSWAELAACGLKVSHHSSYENIDGLVLELFIKSIIYEMRAHNLTSLFTEIASPLHANYFISTEHPGILINEHVSSFNYSVPTFNDYPCITFNSTQLVPLHLTIIQRLKLIEQQLDILSKLAHNNTQAEQTEQAKHL